MKKRFLSGLLTGILCTVLIGSLVLLGFDRISGNTSDNGNSIISEETGASNQTAEELAAKQEVAVFDKKLTYIKSIINKYYLGEVTNEQFDTGILKGLLEALDDPYSCYYTAEEYAALMQSSDGVYCGIGSLVSQNAKTGVITIVKPFVDGPAYKAGMLPGDIIYKVNGTEVTGTDLSTVVSQMKGEKGTNVIVTVVREGEEDPLDLVITRDEIEVPTVEYEMLEDNIGYIYVMEFDKVTVSQFKNAIEDLTKQGMKGLVVDLRDNPGGLYDSAVAMLDRMLPEGLIVYTETKDGTRDEEYSDNKEFFDLPLAVLINGNSASASEIFAGAIQDYGIGTLVGTQSFGKGIVQSVIPLYDGSAVKITVSKYYTPNGRSIHETGITPDVEVELEEGLSKQLVITHDEDNQLQKAVEVILKQIGE